MMKQRTFFQCLAALAILLLCWAVWPAGKARSIEVANPVPEAATEGPGSSRARDTASPSADPLRRRSPVGRSRRPPVPAEVRVSTAETLALINQTPVRLRDLMPVREGEVEKELTPREYSSRLQRAIEMELTFQAAQARKVKLTAAQMQRLEQIASTHPADLAHYQQYGLTWSSGSLEQVEFEKRLLSAQMLEQNLVAEQASVAPSPDPETQARYEQARSELFAELLENAQIVRN